MANGHICLFTSKQILPFAFAEHIVALGGLGLNSQLTNGAAFTPLFKHFDRHQLSGCTYYKWWTSETLLRAGGNPSFLPRQTFSPLFQEALECRARVFYAQLHRARRLRRVSSGLKDPSIRLMRLGRGRWADPGRLPFTTIWRIFRLYSTLSPPVPIIFGFFIFLAH